MPASRIRPKGVDNHGRRIPDIPREKTLALKRSRDQGVELSRRPALLVKLAVRKQDLMKPRLVRLLPGHENPRGLKGACRLLEHLLHDAADHRALGDLVGAAPGGELPQRVGLLQGELVGGRRPPVRYLPVVTGLALLSWLQGVYQMRAV